MIRIIIIALVLALAGCVERSAWEIEMHNCLDILGDWHDKEDVLFCEEFADRRLQYHGDGS